MLFFRSFSLIQILFLSLVTLLNFCEFLLYGVFKFVSHSLIPLQPVV